MYIDRKATKWCGSLAVLIGALAVALAVAASGLGSQVYAAAEETPAPSLTAVPALNLAAEETPALNLAAEEDPASELISGDLAAEETPAPELISGDAAEAPDAPVLTITEQPKDAEVEYPDGAEFSVKVDKPENVKSYQWEARVYSFDWDTDYTLLVLDGSSARTDTLVIPSTEYGMHDHYLRCVITDIYGGKHVSDEAVLKVTNNEEFKPVLYIGEYAVEPGETLDVAETGLGSGTASFAENAVDVTLTDIDLDYREPVFDSHDVPGFGIYLFAGDERPIDERLEYRMRFNGESRINNRFYDPENNDAGVNVNAYLMSDDRDNVPTLIIEGDEKGSPITISGGKHSFYVSNGNLEIAAPNVRTIQKDSVYCESLSAHNILIDENVKLDVCCAGSALVSRRGDIRIFNGADVCITGVTPHISAGLAAISIIRAAQSIYLTDAKVSISGIAIPETAVPYRSAVAMYNGIQCQGPLSLDGSELSIDLSASYWPDRFANNFNGVSGGDNSSIVMSNGSDLSIDVDAPSVFGASGIYLGRNLIMEPGCSIRTFVRAMQRATGITADGRLDVEDSTIESEAEALPFADVPDPEEARGITAGTVDVDIKTSTDHIYSKVNRGAAFAATQYEKIPEESGFDPAYAPEFISLKNKAVINVPEAGVVSSWSFPLEEIQRKSEAVYDPKASEAPAAEVYIGEKTEPEPAEKKDNTLTAKGKKVSLKQSALKKKAKTVKRKNAVTVSKAKGDVTYKLVSVKKAGFKKYFKVSKKSGDLTVKKGLKKGTYKLVVKVSAAGNTIYKAKSKNVTITVTVR